MNKYTRKLADNRVVKYVDRFVQGTLVRRLISHWVSYLLVITFVFAALTWMLTWLVDPLSSTSALVEKFLWRCGLVVAVAVVLVPLFVRDTIQLTHRMVGPMVRVRRELESLASGKTAERIAFRPDDYWQEVADEFNAFCDYVEPRLKNST